MISHDTPRAHMLAMAKEIADKHCVSLTAVFGNKRAKETVAARHEIMYTFKKTGYNWTRISRFIQKDHSTVRHGYQCHATKLEAATRRHNVILTAYAYQPQAAAL